MGTERESVRFPLPFVTLVTLDIATTDYGIDFICRTDTPHLARFKGRPGELSPKARLYLFAGWLLPSRFKCVPQSSTFDYALTDLNLSIALNRPSTDTTGSSAVGRARRCGM